MLTEARVQIVQDITIIAVAASGNSPLKIAAAAAIFYALIEPSQGWFWGIKLVPGNRLDGLHGWCCDGTSSLETAAHRTFVDDLATVVTGISDTLTSDYRTLVARITCCSTATIAICRR